MFFCFFVCCFFAQLAFAACKICSLFLLVLGKLGIAIKDLQSTSQLFKKPDFNNLCE